MHYLDSALVADAALEEQLRPLRAWEASAVAFDARRTAGDSKAARARRHLLREQHVELTFPSHSGELGCETALMGAFFARPGRPIEDSCAEQPIRFVYRRTDGFELR